jgi:hypothetical protein
MADQKLYKWGPKGMLVAKDSDPDDIKFTEKADLGLFGGPTSKIVKNLPGYAWAAKEMKAGTKYAKIADVQALMGGKPVPQPVPNPEPVPAPPAPTPVPPPPPPKAITSLRIQSTGDKVQANVPFTVGQVFAPGDLAEGKGLVGLLEDGTTIPLQFDVKALHSDGSVRHGVVSGVIPSGEPGKDIVVGLAPIAVDDALPRSHDAPRTASALALMVHMERAVDRRRLVERQQVAHQISDNVDRTITQCIPPGAGRCWLRKFSDLCKCFVAFLDELCYTKVHVFHGQPGYC